MLCVTLVSIKTIAV